MSSSPSSSPNALQTVWSRWSTRERRAVSLALTVVLLSVLWWVALAPALRTLAKAPAEHQAMDQKIQQLNGIAQEAALLRAATPLQAAEATAALQATVKNRLGPQTDIKVAEGSATVTLKGVSTDALTQWLTEARTGAHAKPNQAQLRQTPSGWDGTITLTLPTGAAR